MAIEFASKEEGWVYAALADFQKKGLILTFEYQVPIFFPRGQRGGQILDFLVSNPFLTPLQVNGEYWHQGLLSPDESLKQDVIKQKYGRLVIFWGNEMPDQEATYDLSKLWIVDRAGSSKN